MGIHGIDHIIGKPYSLQSDPPRSFNCWSLITYLYPKAPDFTPDALREYVELFNQEKDDLPWDSVADPEPGDVLLFAKNDYFSHAGILVDSTRVLHARDKIGVVIEGLNMLRLRYKNIKAYRWR